MTPPDPGLEIRRVPGGIEVWIHVSPRAKRAAVGGVHGGALRVAVTAPPVGGRANAACVAILAEALGVRRSDVAIDPGARSRRKRVRVSGEPDALSRRLADLGGDTRD